MAIIGGIPHFQTYPYSIANSCCSGGNFGVASLIGEGIEAALMSAHSRLVGGPKRQESRIPFLGPSQSIRMYDFPGKTQGKHGENNHQMMINHGKQPWILGTGMKIAETKRLLLSKEWSASGRVSGLAGFC